MEERDPLLSVNTDELPEQKRSGTMYSSFVNLLLTAAGTGILSLPYTIAQSGILTGNLLLLFVAFVSCYSMDVLVRVSRKFNINTYEGLGQKTYGRVGEILVKVNLLFFLFGAVVIFLIVFFEMLDPFFAFVIPAGSVAEKILSNRIYLTLFGLVAVFPLTMLHSLSGLQFTSTAGVLSLVYILGALIYNLAKKHAIDPTIVPIIQTGHNAIHLVLAIPIQGVAFCAQFNVLPLWAELQQPTLPRMQGVIYSFGAVCFFLYASVALIGYFLFGASTAGNILDNFKANDIPISIGRVALAITILLKVPLCSLPFREVFNELTFAKIFKHRPIPLWVFALENAVMLVIAGILAVVLKDLNTALGLLGGTVGVFISFILPGMFYFKIAEDRKQTAAAIALIVIGIIVMICAIISFAIAL